MRIYQYYRGHNFSYIGKLHMAIHGKFLCGKAFNASIDKCNTDEINFSKGVCNTCNSMFKNKYQKDLNFEVIKLKLGIKNVNRPLT